MLIPFAADIVTPELRGKAVGLVFSGVLAGILLARTVSGVVGQALGWRPMFAIAALAAMLLGTTLYFALPKIASKASLPYSALICSMLRLLQQHRDLRHACMIQACLFAIFSAFWSTLALLLAQPSFNLGSAVAGAFGIVGLVGVAAANASGRLLERYGYNRVMLFGLVCSVGAYLVFYADVSIRGLLVGVVVLDFGMAIANVSNQTMILGLNEQARSRINTIYVTAIFLGGSVGSGVASLAWRYYGWQAVCVFGFAVALLACGIQARDWRAKLATT